LKEIVASDFGKLSALHDIENRLGAGKEVADLTVVSRAAR
jgi:hypothetical protein